MGNGAGTLQVTYLTDYWETFAQSGDFALQSLQVGYDGVWVNSAEYVNVPQYLIDLNVSGIVPSTATNGQTVHVTTTLADFYMGPPTLQYDVHCAGDYFPRS